MPATRLDVTARTRAAQAGVVSRRQLLAQGGSDLEVDRRLRRREWSRVHPGVYVDHTGPLTWEQRAWAATLLHEPAALAGASALRAQESGQRRGARVDVDDAVVELVVDRSRRVDDPPGVRTSQVRDYDRVVLDHSPPRVRLEHAALWVASRATGDDQTVAVLGDLVQAGRTTAARLLSELEHHPRLRRRRLLLEVLGEVSVGALSALERRYLRDVERAHCLPTAERQVRSRAGAGGVVVRDVDYAPQRLVVELDGRVGHDASLDAWADLDRDLDAALAGRLTVRLRWGHVLRACDTAYRVGMLLGRRGWAGEAARCSPTCSVPAAG